MFLLIRNKRTEAAILGDLYFKGALICNTLENALKAIPKGNYIVNYCKSPKFSRKLPLLSGIDVDVKASRGIRIHRGNSVKDTAGCILVGEKTDKDTLIESANYEIMVSMLSKNECLIRILEDY